MPRAWPVLAILLSINISASAQENLSGPFAAYNDLLKQTRTYEQLRTGGHWETVCDERFTDAARGDWHMNTPGCVSELMANPQAFGLSGDPSQTMATATVGTVDGAPALVMDASQDLMMQVAVGPPVRCGMAIEMVAKSVDGAAPGSTGEMTVVFDGMDSGPAFRFGCHQNTADELWIPRPPAPANQPMAAVSYPVELPARRVGSGGWDHIRLEVRDGVVSASANGDVLGSARLTADGDFLEALHQANIFSSHGAIAVREVIVQHYAVLKHPLSADDAWSEAFGSQSRAEVDGKVDQLIELLGDDDPAVRDTAQRVLMELGNVAADRVKMAAKDRSEIGSRAAWIVRCLHPGEPVIPALPPELQRLRFAGWMMGSQIQLYEQEMFMRDLLLND